MDRRAIFFLGAAVACGVLTPFTPSNLRWFSIMLAAVYVALAAASALDNWSRSKQPRSRG